MKEKKYQHPTKALSEICTVTSKIFSVQLQLNIVRTSSSNPLDSSEDLRIIPSLLFQPSFSLLTISLDAKVFGGEGSNEMV